MKWLIAILLTILCCIPVQACNGYAAGYGIGYSYAPQAAFYIQPPVQTVIQYIPAPPIPVQTTTYSYSAPLSTILQYGAPLYAPVQPYYTNFNIGNYGGGYANFNRGFAFNNNVNHHNYANNNFNNNVGRSVNIRTPFSNVTIRR